MLHYATIYPETLRLLREIQSIEYLKKHFLVGGTSLALQIGHRISVDLDLFAHHDTNVSEVIDHISHLGRIRIVNQSKRILNLFIGDVKVDFVSYRYHYLNPPIEKDNLRLASIEDIAAMKISAITGRGSKKDFVDLFFLLKSITLPEIMDLFKMKYPESTDFLVYKSLCYFEDADIEPMPKMLKEVDWQFVKSSLVEEVRKHFP